MSYYRRVEDERGQDAERDAPALGPAMHADQRDAADHAVSSRASSTSSFKWRLMSKSGHSAFRSMPEKYGR